MRQMGLVAFLQAQNCTTLPASWRHPKARTDSTSPDYYRHIARVLSHTNGQIGAAAEILGIHRNTLTRKMKEYGL